MWIDRKRQCGTGLFLTLALAGYTVGPNYKRPTVEIPADYRSATEIVDIHKTIVDIDNRGHPSKYFLKWTLPTRSTVRPVVFAVSDVLPFS